MKIKKTLLIFFSAVNIFVLSVSIIILINVQILKNKTNSILETSFKLLELETETKERLISIEEKIVILSGEEADVNRAFEKKIMTETERADIVFSEKKWGESYLMYKSILDKDSGNIYVRLRKMLSLFYMNKLDSLNYSEILEDCYLLKKSGCKDKRIGEIEEFIKKEGGE